MFNDKVTKSVADAAAKIMMAEKLHPNQQKIDVVDDEKIDGKDFAKLRKMKKEEVELNLEDYSLEELEEFMVSEEYQQLDELSKTTLGSYVNKASKDASTSSSASSNWAHTSDKARNPRVKVAAAKYSDEENARKQKRLAGVGNAVKRLTKEAIEQLLEYETDKNGRYVHNAKAGRYGGSEKPQDPFAGVRGPKQSDLSAIEAEKRKKKKKFSEMVDTYQSGGIKELFKEMAIEEEASQEEFNAELEKQKKKAEGKGEKAEVAKAAVQAVQQEDTEIQVINADIANGVESTTIEERSLTDAEAAKKEEIVKSMKKGIAGFKERYGKDAKSVMYATATKQAKGE
jgi:hypothetical protein